MRGPLKRAGYGVNGAGCSVNGALQPPRHRTQRGEEGVGSGEEGCVVATPRRATARTQRTGTQYRASGAGFRVFDSDTDSDSDLGLLTRILTCLGLGIL